MMSLLLKINSKQKDLHLTPAWFFSVFRGKILKENASVKGVFIKPGENFELMDLPVVSKSFYCRRL